MKYQFRYGAWGMGRGQRDKGTRGQGERLVVSSPHLPISPSPSLTPRLSSFFILLITIFLGIGLVSCGGKSPTVSQTNTPDSSDQDSKLTFFDVTLEQADEVGRPIWKVQAKRAKYTKEKQIGQVENPYGELYQDGKIVYQVKADVADIEQNGKQLFLKGKIFATDPKKWNCLAR